MFEDVDGTRVVRETGMIGCQMGVAHRGSLVRLRQLTIKSLVWVISPRTGFLCGKGRNVSGKFSNFFLKFNKFIIINYNF